MCFDWSVVVVVKMVVRVNANALNCIAKGNLIFFHRFILHGKAISNVIHFVANGFYCSYPSISRYKNQLINSFEYTLTLFNP